MRPFCKSLRKSVKFPLRQIIAVLTTLVFWGAFPGWARAQGAPFGPQRSNRLLGTKARDNRSDRNRRLGASHSLTPNFPGGSTAGSIFLEAPTSRSGGYDTLSIAAADLNGDNKVDMVLVNDDGTVSVLLGNGDGTFTTAVNYEAGGGATSYQNSPVPTITPNLVAIADVNGDGKPDLLVTSTCAADDCSSGSVGVLLGNGDGTFRPAVSYGSGGSIATSVAVADVNGDGNLDLLVANDCTSIDGNGNCLGAETVGVLLGKGDGTFRNAVVYPSGGYYGNDSASASVVAADLNGDGAPDLVVSNNCTSVDSNGFCLDTGTVGVLLNNGAGTFLPAVVYATGGRDPGPPAILADPNGGSRSAIAVANLCSLHDCVSDSPVGVLLGNGDGTFQSAVVYDSGGNSATQVVVAYVNGDINPDLLVLSQCSDNCEGNGIVGVLLGGFKWSFSSPLTYDAGGSATSLTSADVNGDGNLDLLIANASDNLNTNFGAFGVYWATAPANSRGRHITAATTISHNQSLSQI